MLDSRALLLATMLVAVSSACSDSRHEDMPSEPDPGATQQAFCFNHTIVNVVVAPGTYHWEDPGHLLSAAEGFGPLSLNLAIQTGQRCGEFRLGNIRSPKNRPWQMGQPASISMGRFRPNEFWNEVLHRVSF